MFDCLSISMDLRMLLNSESNENNKASWSSRTLVTFAISSKVVKPAATFLTPDLTKVRIPELTASFKIRSSDALLKIRVLIFSVTFNISKIEILP
jgi:hypothetical protein